VVRKAEIIVTAKGEVFLSAKGDLLRERTVQHETVAVQLSLFALSEVFAQTTEVTVIVGHTAG
jgi:hypothetical protein